MIAPLEPVEGQTFEIEYPFILGDYDPGDDGRPLPQSWKPGIRIEADEYDSYAFADGVGKMTLVFVAQFKPGRYPTRVFFTRQFTAPDGRTFGKSKLHICTLEKFRRISSGYLYDFELAGIRRRA